MDATELEQAARARGFEERCMGILERCVQAVELLDRLDDRREAEMARLNVELGEMRDGMLALSNRIESVTRQRTIERQCSAFARTHAAHVYYRDNEMFVCHGVSA